MGEESAAKAVREHKPDDKRHEREEAVKAKYDFSVIRTLRQQRKLTIEQFAKRCGLSYAPISRIETNLIKPNLDTLDKIALGLGVTTGELVTMAERRKAQRVEVFEKRGSPTFHGLETDELRVFYAQSRRDERWSLDRVGLDGRRLLLVRSGSVDVSFDENTHHLSAGQAIRFDHDCRGEVLSVEDSDVVVIGYGVN